MKTFVSIVIGVFVGVFLTYFMMRQPNDNPRGDSQSPSLPDISEPLVEDSSRDPFPFFGDLPSATEHTLEYTDLDMNDPTQRDMFVSLWYLDMQQVVDAIEKRTGHKFTKEVAKVAANPVEILEEQAAFMKDFQSKTERIASDENQAAEDDNQ